MIRPSHLFTHDLPTSSGVKEPISTRLEDKFCFGVACKASNAAVTCNVETNVRRGGSDDPGSPSSPTDRRRGEGCCSGSRLVEALGKTKYVDGYTYTGYFSRTQLIATVDNTLSLLYNSALSRGLPHKLTRNLHTLSNGRKGWLRSAYERPSAPWRPGGSQAHVRPKKHQSDQNESGEFAWNMVGEVVRMAEGRDQLILGHAPQRQRKTYRNLK